MKTKKLLSLVLALAMIFTMSVTVFASTSSNEFKANATVKIAAIDVTVPQSTSLFINPMGFTVKIATGAAASVTEAAADDGSTTNQKIVSPVNVITNKSPMKLDVKVSGVLTPDDANNKALTVVDQPWDSSETRNTVFIYALFGTPDVSGTNPTLTYKAYAAGKEAEGILGLSTRAPQEPIKVGQIAAADSSGDVNYGFQLLGDCNANAREAWNEGDKVEVSLTFTFVPVT